MHGGVGLLISHILINLRKAIVPPPGQLRVARRRRPSSSKLRQRSQCSFISEAGATCGTSSYLEWCWDDMRRRLALSGIVAEIWRHFAKMDGCPGCFGTMDGLTILSDRPNVEMEGGRR